MNVAVSQFRQMLAARLKGQNGRAVLRVVTGQTEPAEFDGPKLQAESLRIAEQAKAEKRGVVLLLLPHSPELFLLHIGLILTDRIPAILAWPTTRVDPEKYQRNLIHQLRNLPAAEIITTADLAESLRRELPYTVTVCSLRHSIRGDFGGAGSLSRNLAKSEYRFSALISDDALFLQFSGGTTGAQKAVVITPSMLLQQLELLKMSLGFGEEDGVCSWLPMYHDMGLIACLWLPLWQGASSLQFAAGDWLLSPGLLFEYAERYRATFCWLPNFAFSYLAAQRQRIAGPHSLGHVRAWINCSEPVRLRSFRAFAETFADWGVRMEQLQASYAMAENVFAVTQTKVGIEPVTFPRARLRASSHERSTLAFDLIDDVYVSSGPPIPGMHVRIQHADGRPCRDREAGEIQLHTASLFSGYWGDRGFVTSAFTADGWYATGDYGFMNDGELYVIGRSKDIIIIGGQNVFPEDVEVVVNSVPGVYPGRVVAFGIADAERGTESLVVVAEARNALDETGIRSLQREISQLVLSSIGIAPRHVMVVPERWIVKSTAGKISRKETGQRYLAERSQPEHARAGAP
jgi:fatty-acyl-CoA synthase